VDHRLVRDGAVGPLTRRLSHLFYEAVHGTGKHSPEWCDYLEPLD